jgi:hypothetical protein
VVPPTYVRTTDNNVYPLDLAYVHLLRVGVGIGRCRPELEGKKFNHIQVSKVGKFTDFTDHNAFSTPTDIDTPKTSLNRIPKQNKTRNQNQTTTLSIENNKTPKTSLKRRPNQNKTRNQNHDGWVWVQNQWVPELRYSLAMGAKSMGVSAGAKVVLESSPVQDPNPLPLPLCCSPTLSDVHCCGASSPPISAVVPTHTTVVFLFFLGFSFFKRGE